MKKNNKGFSLVELIIVIAILGILAAVATVSLIKYLDRTKKSADVQSAKAILEEFTDEYYTNPEFHDACSSIASQGNLIAVTDSASGKWTCSGNLGSSTFFTEDCPVRNVKYQKPIYIDYDLTPVEAAAGGLRYCIGGSLKNITPTEFAIWIVDDEPIVYVVDNTNTGVSPLVCYDYPGAPHNGDAN